MQTPARRDTLLRRAKDAGTVAGSRIIRQIVMIVVMATGARILEKEELGIWALISIIIQFGVLVSDTGISTFIVRHRQMDRRMFGTAWLLGLLVAAFLSAMLSGIGASAFHLLGLSEFTPHVLTATLAIIAFTMNGLLQAMLRRERKFTTIFWSDALSNSVMLVGSVWLLLCGAGLWAFVVPTILSALGGFAVCSFATGIPKPCLARREVREIVDYASGLVGFSSTYFWARNIDQLLVGRFLGASQLGVYSLAIRIMMMPLSQVNATAQTVALPYLAPHQDNPERLRSSIRALTVLIGMLTTLPMIWIWLEREFLVGLLLGEGWGGVAELLVVLAPLAILQTLVNPIGLCYQVRGETNRLFRIGLIHTAVTLLGFAIGIASGSLSGVVIAYAISNVLVAPLSVGQGLETVGGRFRDWLAWTAPLLACLPVCWIATRAIPVVGSTWLHAAMTLAVCTLASSPLYLYAFRRTFGMIRLRSRVARNRLAAPSVS